MRLPLFLLPALSQGIMVVGILCSSHLVYSEEAPFYQDEKKKPTPKIIKGAKTASEEAEITLQAITGLCAHEPGVAVAAEQRGIRFDVQLAQQQEYAIKVFQFLESRCRFKGILSAFEMQIMENVFDNYSRNFSDIPENTLILLKSFYEESYYVSELTALDQRRALCNLLHPIMVPDPITIYFDISPVVKRFKRRFTYLYSKGAERKPLPTVINGENPF